ncbi:MAG TPA: hypothetical protein VG474_09965, partial [Solirubrobacteraceae bacterium]|nr:hypothetical protein [Solirubrobacteraceae bacterium]
MLGHFGLPMAGCLKEVDNHVGLKKRASRLRDLHPSAPAARRVGIQQAVVDGIVKHLRKQGEHHVHRPWAESSRHERLAEAVNAPRVDRRRRLVRELTQQVVQPPAIVPLRLALQFADAALPPARRRDVKRFL